MEDKNKENRAEWIRSLGLFGVVLTDFIGLPGIGIAVGVWGMKNHGWPIWIAGALGILGLSYGAWKMARNLRK